MSIASEIARLQQAKADLKEAINSKGGNITTERIDQFASEVAALPTAIELTQTQYDALSTKDSNTYYLIVAAELADVLKIYKGSELVYEKEVEPNEKLSTPQNVTADGTTVSWDEVENATSYEIFANGVSIGEGGI